MTVSTDLSAARRRRLWIELGLLFVLLPLGAWQGFEWARAHSVRLPIIPAILALGLTCWFWLRAQPDFDRRRLWKWPRDAALWRRILVRFAVAAVLLTGLTLLLKPDGLLGFPRRNPTMWMVVMIGYPLVSVLPQELAYRAFFLHRYGPLTDSVQLRVLLSGLTFGLVHIIFGRELSVLLSALGGLFFAESYLRAGSIWAAWIEHALYGCFVFTIGLGEWFYMGGTFR
jgi:hypothetical protein